MNAKDILTKRDQCDRCGVPAVTGYTKGEGELMFCNHHDRAHGPTLLASGWELVADSRPALASTK